MQRKDTRTAEKGTGERDMEKDCQTCIGHLARVMNLWKTVWMDGTICI